MIDIYWYLNILHNSAIRLNVFLFSLYEVMVRVCLKGAGSSVIQTDESYMTLQLNLFRMSVCAQCNIYVKFHVYLTCIPASEYQILYSFKKGGLMFRGSFEITNQKMPHFIIFKKKM